MAKKQQDDQPSNITNKRVPHGISFCPCKQHTTNSKFYLVCTVCGKSQVMHVQKAPSARRLHMFKRVVSDLFCVCEVEELAGLGSFSECYITMLQNLQWSDLVKTIYYCAGHIFFCCWFVTKRESKLSIGSN